MSNGPEHKNYSPKNYTAAEPSLYIQWRNEAKARLEAGTATNHSHCWFLDVDTLQVLHRLSIDPETAGDALKLLHELQVHQVEMDTQFEEMHDNEQRLVEERSRYRELFEYAPLGYFLIDFEGEIIESNQLGAELFGIEQDELRGGRIDRFLAPESRSVIRGLLDNLGEDGTTLGCEVAVEGDIKTFRSLRVMARVSPDNCCVLLAFCEGK